MEVRELVRLLQAVEALAEAPPTGDHLVQRVATEIRHRNEDVVPGRIVHVSRGTDWACVAAIIVETPSANHPAAVGLRMFNALAAPALEDGYYYRDDSGREALRWHFSIACPFAKKAVD